VGVPWVIPRYTSTWICQVLDHAATAVSDLNKFTTIIDPPHFVHRVNYIWFLPNVLSVKIQVIVVYYALTLADLQLGKQQVKVPRIRKPRLEKIVEKQAASVSINAMLGASKQRCAMSRKRCVQ